jgi:hypothetical protein
MTVSGNAYNYCVKVSNGYLRRNKWWLSGVIGLYGLCGQVNARYKEQQA